MVTAVGVEQVDDVGIDAEPVALTRGSTFSARISTWWMKSVRSALSALVAGRSCRRAAERQVDLRLPLRLNWNGV